MATAHACWRGCRLPRLFLWHWLLQSARQQWLRTLAREALPRLVESVPVARALSPNAELLTPLLNAFWPTAVALVLLTSASSPTARALLEMALQRCQSQLNWCWWREMNQWLSHRCLLLGRRTHSHRANASCFGRHTNGKRTIANGL